MLMPASSAVAGRQRTCAECVLRIMLQIERLAVPIQNSLVPEHRRVDVVKGRHEADVVARRHLAQQRLRLPCAQPCSTHVAYNCWWDTACICLCGQQSVNSCRIVAGIATPPRPAAGEVEQPVSPVSAQD